MVEKIFFDMDGVLADFDRGVKELCGLTPMSQNDKHRSRTADDAMWAKIREIGHFYDKLELMPGAARMFEEIYGRYDSKCEILTGIPKPRRGILCAGEDKTRWVRRLLSEDITVNIVLREEKPQYCTGKVCILIDDMEKNIKEWEAAGGTGILHVSADETLKRLAAL
ncbi:MAG: hypothetical protein K6B72_10150 [Lachnospiraceae bacterium]|nr:hypothetical protein [Lachnospiraceae bacterium]